MSRYPLYFLLAVSACFVAGSALATPIRILLASPGGESVPTEATDFESLEDNNVHIVTSMTQGTGIEGDRTALEGTSARSSGQNRNANVLLNSQPQMGGVALALNSLVDDDDDSSSGGFSGGPSAQTTGTSVSTGPGDTGVTDPPAHMPEPGAALLFAVGAWIAGRRFRR